ncbi:MAG: hypothetical protein Q4Q53_08190 [Methanocorpusculum sp.]|nr:hypothetical protein [Methanocorpusculum sp.]
MEYNKQLREIDVGKQYSRRDLLRVLQKENPELSDNSLSWILSDELSEGSLCRIGRNRYITASKPVQKTEYIYTLSKTASNILHTIEKKLPQAEFQIWETIQYNEFINHQIAQNTIFLEVEKMLIDSVYDLISENKKLSILVNPKIADFNRYNKNDTVVIMKLTTESPAEKINKHQPALEKLITDLAANKLINKIISSSEYFGIITNAVSCYKISSTALARYANRRTALSKIQPYLPDELKEKGN